MIPLEVADQHLSILGKTGSGKTFAAKELVERLIDEGRRVCIIDPTGVSWGLKYNSAGDRPGKRVAVFGCKHDDDSRPQPDVIIDKRSGDEVARLVAENRTAVIIDVSEMLVGERAHFAEDFFAALYRLNRSTLHLVIDEADEFARQNPLPEHKRLFHQVDRIVRRGRARGFRVLMISQRPAVLHKDVLTQSNALVVMKLTSPQDRKAIDEWVKGQADADQAKDVYKTLPRLARGTGWLWAPEQEILERRTFPPISTFDSSAAPEDRPKLTYDAEPFMFPEFPSRVGEEPPEPAPEITDPTLEKIAANEKAKSNEAARDKAFKEGFAQGMKLAYAEWVKLFEAFREDLNYAADKVQEVATTANNLMSTPTDIVDPSAPLTFNAANVLQGHKVTEVHVVSNGKEIPASYDPETGEVKVREAFTPAPGTTFKVNISEAMDRMEEAIGPPKYQVGDLIAPVTTPSGKAGGAELRVLAVLAGRHPARLTEATWATLAGLKRTGGTWKTYKSRLRSAGYLDETPQGFVCSWTGLEAVGKTNHKPLQGAALIEHWKSAIPGAGPMLGMLASIYPDWMPREQLARRLDLEPTGGTFKTYLSRLSGNGLLEKRADGRVRASEDLFR